MRTKIARMSLAVMLAMCGGAGAVVAQGRSDGIKVHGHWTIDVRNPDGTLVSHHDFENALVTGMGRGNDALANVLSGQKVGGTWMVNLFDHQPEASPCFTIGPSGPSPWVCSILEVNETTSDTYDLPTFFRNLTRQAANTTVELYGTVTAARNGGIAIVQTAVALCGPTVAPAGCNLSTGDSYAMTQRTLPQAISVTTGQIVQVKVVISFS